MKTTIHGEKMTDVEFSEYVMSECRRQWKDNQEKYYGIWDEQSDDAKAEYYNDMYDYLQIH